MSRFLKLALLVCFLGLGTLISLAGCHPLSLNLLRNGSEPAERPETSTAAPEKTSFRLDPYLFVADFELNRNLPLFQELEHLRDQVYRELQLPESNRIIQVYLYQTRDKYEKAMKARYPQLPGRRAFFVAQPRAFGGGEDLLVYTYWGEQIQEDLRHELTHALLHSVLKDVPIWLDEGLAEFFETPPGWKGINPRHLENLRKTGAEKFQPNLERLEKLKDVPDMTPAEYRESWAWVHFMLRGHPEGRKILIAYLRELRMSGNPDPMRPRLQTVIPNLDTALRQHLGRLDGLSPGMATTTWRRGS